MTIWKSCLRRSPFVHIACLMDVRQFKDTLLFHVDRKFTVFYLSQRLFSVCINMRIGCIYVTMFHLSMFQEGTSKPGLSALRSIAKVRYTTLHNKSQFLSLLFVLFMVVCFVICYRSSIVSSIVCYYSSCYRIR